MDYLARTQADDGAWRDGQGGRSYPVAMSALACTALLANGNSPTRGRYSEQLKRGTEYLLQCAAANKSGLITGPNQDNGQPMHGHGFALMYLASVYGMETDEAKRTAIHDAVEKAVNLTARGQSTAGGWTYIPGGGDEGSVTVTQVQALRAAQNSGFEVPKGTIENAVRYIERCSTPEGGICYSLVPAAARPACRFRPPRSPRCTTPANTIRRWPTAAWITFGSSFEGMNGWSKRGGHDFYTHLYASQAFYMAGDKYWDKYFPATRDELLKMQNNADGSWEGDGIGKHVRNVDRADHASITLQVSAGLSAVTNRSQGSESGVSRQVF